MLARKERSDGMATVYRRCDRVSTERRHFSGTSSHAKPRPNGCRLVAERKTNRRRGLSVDLAETPKGDPSAKRRIADGLFLPFPKTSPQCLHELPNVGISQLPLPHTKGDARRVSPFAWWEEVDLAETPEGDPSAKRRIADRPFFPFRKTLPQCLHELPNVGIP